MRAGEMSAGSCWKGMRVGRCWKDVPPAIGISLCGGREFRVFGRSYTPPSSPL